MEATREQNVAKIVASKPVIVLVPEYSVYVLRQTRFSVYFLTLPYFLHHNRSLYRATCWTSWARYKGQYLCIMAALRLLLVHETNGKEVYV